MGLRLGAAGATGPLATVNVRLGRGSSGGSSCLGLGTGSSVRLPVHFSGLCRGEAVGGRGGVIDDPGAGRAALPRRAAFDGLARDTTRTV